MSLPGGLDALFPFNFLGNEVFKENRSAVHLLNVNNLTKYVLSYLYYDFYKKVTFFTTKKTSKIIITLMCIILYEDPCILL